MARTDVQDRVTLVNGVAETLSKVVPNACTSSELVLDSRQFPIGAIVEIKSQVSYDDGRTWKGSGGCVIRISDPSKDPQDRAQDGIVRFFSGSSEMRGKVGVQARSAFMASLDGVPISRGFDLVTGFEDDRLKLAQAQVEAKELK
jgi:hypothetical protein